MQQALKGLGMLSFFLTALAYALEPSQFALERLHHLKLKQNPNWTFKVDYNPVLERDPHRLTGYVRAPRERGAQVQTLATTDLPAAFDWREEAHGLSPIKDQGQCGSCWAFGSMATLENAIKIKDQQVVSLSEQQLVSCNQDGWGCDGGNTALKYLVSPGSETTQQFPYQAADVGCPGHLQPQYHADSWAYVGNETQDQDLLPSVEAIKTAVYKYGVVSVAIAATDSFMGYSSGVYNDCNSNSINHLVAIVGWQDTGKDAQGKPQGYWIGRNSWGSSWGEQGYFRIQYACNGMGTDAAYVVYKGAFH